MTSKDQEHLYCVALHATAREQQHGRDLPLDSYIAVTTFMIQLTVTTHLPNYTKIVALSEMSSMVTFIFNPECLMLGLKQSAWDHLRYSDM